MNINSDIQRRFSKAIQSDEPVSGYTHKFYRYPARFSPLFVRVAVEAFTQPGDLILDPFVGGGTSLVEASVLGRRALGTDISSLAVFISKAKTTLLSKEDCIELNDWLDGLQGELNLRNRSRRPTNWIDAGYQKNINSRSVWAMRKTFELALNQIDGLSKKNQQRFARCVLLRTAQWALDGRLNIPAASRFRRKFFENFREMMQGSKDYATKLSYEFSRLGYQQPFKPICLQRSAIDIEKDHAISEYSPPALIITSPPYPGVHILYHRWQVQGRRETPAPFWIANCLDGRGASYYTFGDRKTHGSGMYYEEIEKSFLSLSKIANNNTIFVQLMGFSDPVEQLPQYIFTLEKAGLEEINFPELSNSPDNRIWRNIPNRRWYTDLDDNVGSGREVVLFHKLK